MGMKGGFSFFGQMTDLNIWSRAFTEKEVAYWTNCMMDIEGDLLNWMAVNWTKYNISSDVVSRKEVCIGNRRMHIVSSSSKKDMDETIKFCEEAFGGQIAVADNNITLQDMVRSIKKIGKKNCGVNFFTGFTDRAKEGKFKNVITGENMYWAPWHETQPNNLGEEDCTDYRTDTRGLYDINCNVVYCPVCKVMELTTFELSGVEIGSRIDKMYLLLNSNEFLGFSETKMMWNSETALWTIVSQVDGTHLATLNQTDPFGRKSWNLVDRGQVDMNFHIHVRIPGNFCCNSGVCINSELRCDNKDDCDDHSDEKLCQMVQFPTYSYRKDKPPFQVPVCMNIAT